MDVLNRIIGRNPDESDEEEKLQIISNLNSNRGSFL